MSAPDDTNISWMSETGQQEYRRTREQWRRNQELWGSELLLYAHYRDHTGKVESGVVVGYNSNQIKNQFYFTVKFDEYAVAVDVMYDQHDFIVEEA